MRVATKRGTTVLIPHSPKFQMITAEGTYHVTGHFQTIEPNDPKMTLKTTKVKRTPYLSYKYTARPQL